MIAAAPTTIPDILRCQAQQCGTLPAIHYLGDDATWQWLSSDRINYKYQIESLTPQQEPGKVGFYGFRMKLRKVDILAATAQTFGAIQ